MIIKCSGVNDCLNQLIDKSLGQTEFNMIILSLFFLAMLIFLLVIFYINVKYSYGRSKI